MRPLRLSSCVVAIPLLCLTLAGHASAAPILVVTPGEQNTYSGENSCDPNCDAAIHGGSCHPACDAGHWLHYPQLVQNALGAGYKVQDDGDGGAVIGCDAASKAITTGSGSFCNNTNQYKASIATPPGIAIIGPFGEHDLAIVDNHTQLNTEAAYEAAYEALVQVYLKLNARVYMMTPVDVPLAGSSHEINNGDFVKDILLPASLKVAQNHSLPVIDTYTAISGTQMLATMYYGSDGQVTAAAQQKMADLIVASIMSNGTGGSGSGGAGGAGGAAGASGSGGANAGGAGGTGGTSGSGGSGGSLVDSGGAPTGTAGSTTVAGAGGASTGSAGATATAGATAAAGSSAVSTPSSSSDSSGCSVSGPSRSGWGAGFALSLLALAAFARKRRAS